MDKNYGCVMLELDVPNWFDIISTIDQCDLYLRNGFGLELEPHITVFYGIDPEVKDSDVLSIMRKYRNKNFNIEGSGIDCFKNDLFEVVKFKIIADTLLTQFNEELGTLPNSNEFPIYNPHITIGYVSNNRSDKYIDPYKKLEFSIRSILYSNSDNNKISII